jgi:hypothetical protein
VRVIQDDGEIFGYGHYFKKIPDSLKAKWAIWKKNIELRFTQRISSEDKAFEVGFYKTTSTNIQTGEQRKALVVFTYCYEKKMEPGKLLWMLTPREGLQRKVSKKPSPCSYNCFPITAEINFSFEKNPELYNKR